MSKRNLSLILAALAFLAACGESEPEEDALFVVSFDEPTNTNRGGGNNQAPSNANTNSTPTDPEPSSNNATTVVPPTPNEGWIGGACAAASECDYDGAMCLTTGHPGGQCSKACDGSCPGLDGSNSETFCIDGGSQGRCVSQCDTGLYTYDGCRDGYACQIRTQFGEPSVREAVCVPDGTPPEVIVEPEPEPPVPCLEQLDNLGVNYRAWSYSTEYTEGLACTIDDPIYVQSPLNGINYRYYTESSPGEVAMACELALALHQFAEILKEFDIVEVEHIGTFNCRKIGGTNYLSMHGLGLAIDFYGFVDANGADYVLERDWEHDTNTPVTAKGRKLYDITARMAAEQSFNYILTPNYNDAHDNHIHVDLTPGVFYIGLYASPYELGDDCGN